MFTHINWSLSTQTNATAFNFVEKRHTQHASSTDIYSSTRASRRHTSVGNGKDTDDRSARWSSPRMWTVNLGVAACAHGCARPPSPGWPRGGCPVVYRTGQRAAAAASTNVSSVRRSIGGGAGRHRRRERLKWDLYGVDPVCPIPDLVRTPANRPNDGPTCQRECLLPM